MSSRVLNLCAMLAMAMSAATKPNIMFLLVDDSGFGDWDMCHLDLTPEQCEVVPPGNAAKRLSGNMRTPRMKALAQGGQIMNNWYSPRAICTPSRAATLSGRDPVYFGGIGEFLRIYPSNPARGGYPHSELSVAEYMKEEGYVTGYSGKWHIGLTNGSEHPYAYAPVHHGFDHVDQWIAGSNGEPCSGCNMNVPGDGNIYHMCTFSQIMTFDENKQGHILEQPIRWENITSRLLTAPLKFLDNQADSDQPFFYIHAFAKTHVPWVPSRFFVSSTKGIWMDAVGEVDWAVGVIIDKLKEIEKYNNTLVILTSDNGPYKEFASTFVPQNCKFGGCSEETMYEPGDGGVPIPENCELATDFTQVSTAGRFAGGKGNTFEGGLRMPTIVSWPGSKMPKGVINNVVASSMDILPTAVAVAGGTLDESVTINGRNILPQLLAPAAWDSTPEGTFVYWCGIGINAVRIDQHKILFFTQRFTAGTDNESPLTPEDRCDGGTCCDGSPGRLCTCIVGQMHDPPLVIDLETNPAEDFSLALDPADPATNAIVQAGTALRMDRYKSVLDELNIPYSSTITATKILQLLARAPNNVQIDACIFNKVLVPDYVFQATKNTCGLVEGDRVACPYVPKACQIEEFAPYQNCAIVGMGATCQMRRPCCDGGPDYVGPFEYQNPIEGSNNRFDKCGCFNQPQGNSYFPEFLLPSVCEWQEDAGLTDSCSPPVCSIGDTMKPWLSTGLPCSEKNLRNYGLYNEAYPDSQVVDECKGSCLEGTECENGKCACASTAACCEPSASPSCGRDTAATSTTVAECVCAFDSYCCEAMWDAQCVGEARDRCGLECPAPNAI